jgi:hypothetical protein
MINFDGTSSEEAISAQEVEAPGFKSGERRFEAPRLRSRVNQVGFSPGLFRTWELQLPRKRSLSLGLQPLKNVRLRYHTGANAFSNPALLW